ncbi:hypothetical protein ANN_17275, partial [Periplaneta americana]
MVCFFSFIAYVGTYAKLVAIACSQLEKLRIAILDIRQTRFSENEDSGAKTDYKHKDRLNISTRNFCEMQRRLNSCVRHHQDILEYMRAMEATLSPMILLHFLLIVTGLCFAAFSAVISGGNIVQLGQILLIVIATLVQLLTYCQLGTELTTQAELVSSAAWECDWIGTPVSFQRCLIFIIVTANTEFHLTA